LPDIETFFTNMRSKVLQRTGVIEIGRKSPIGTGRMEAYFHCRGTNDVTMDLLNRRAMGLQTRSSAVAKRPRDETDAQWVCRQEALLSQRGRAMIRVCIASIQNVEHSLLLLVVSASDIPLHAYN